MSDSETLGLNVDPMGVGPPAEWLSVNGAERRLGLLRSLGNGPAIQSQLVGDRIKSVPQKSPTIRDGRRNERHYQNGDDDLFLHSSVFSRYLSLI